MKWKIVGSCVYGAGGLVSAFLSGSLYCRGKAGVFVMMTLAVVMAWFGIMYAVDSQSEGE